MHCLPAGERRTFQASDHGGKEEEAGGKEEGMEDHRTITQRFDQSCALRRELFLVVSKKFGHGLRALFIHAVKVAQKLAGEEVLDEEEGDECECDTPGGADDLKGS